ncbi:MAG: hypothetical protein PHP86_06925 [Nevskiales bacterium]|nr:hypothetical protein [Nevskiales bacterium]
MNDVILGAIRMRTGMRAGLVAGLSLLMLGACAGPRRAGMEHADIDELRHRFEAADVDGDEALTPAEAEAGMPQLLDVFATVDTDHNGRATLAEIRSYLQWQRIANAPPPDVRDVRQNRYR